MLEDSLTHTSTFRDLAHIPKAKESPIVMPSMAGWDVHPPPQGRGASEHLLSDTPDRPSTEPWSWEEPCLPAGFSSVRWDVLPVGLGFLLLAAGDGQRKPGYRERLQGLKGRIYL